MSLGIRLEALPAVVEVSTLDAKKWYLRATTNGWAMLREDPGVPPIRYTEENWNWFVRLADLISPEFEFRFWESGSDSHPVGVHNWGSLVLTIDFPEDEPISWYLFKHYVPIHLFNNAPGMVKVLLRTRRHSPASPE